MIINPKTNWNFDDALKMIQILYSVKEKEGLFILENISNLLEQNKMIADVYLYETKNDEFGFFWDYAGILWDSSGIYFSEKIKNKEIFELQIQKKDECCEHLITQYPLDDLLVLQHETLECEIYNYVIETGSCFAKQPKIKEKLHLEEHYYFHELTSLDDIYFNNLKYDVALSIKEISKRMDNGPLHGTDKHEKYKKESEYISNTLNNFNSLKDVIDNKSPTHTLLIPYSYHSNDSKIIELPLNFSSVKKLNFNASNQKNQIKIIELMCFDFLIKETEYLKEINTRLFDNPILFKESYIEAAKNFITKPEDIPRFCFDGECFYTMVEQHKIESEINSKVAPNNLKKEKLRF